MHILVTGIVCEWVISLLFTHSKIRTVTLFIIRLAPWAGKMNQIACFDWLPEWARLSYLAHSGLPAISREKNFPESQIINPLLTKLFRSRWLDFGLVLFFVSLWTIFMDFSRTWQTSTGFPRIQGLFKLWIVTQPSCSSLLSSLLFIAI